MNDYTNIRLDKTMYRADKSFSQQLEMMDPSDRYTGPLGRLDAFQRQLKRFDIKVGGSGQRPDCQVLCHQRLGGPLSGIRSPGGAAGGWRKPRRWRRSWPPPP